MELETVNKLYLELSQVATAKTARELELEDLLTSARAIAQRGGEAARRRNGKAGGMDEGEEFEQVAAGQRLEAKPCRHGRRVADQRRLAGGTPRGVRRR